MREQKRRALDITGGPLAPFLIVITITCFTFVHVTPINIVLAQGNSWRKLQLANPLQTPKQNFYQAQTLPQ